MEVTAYPNCIEVLGCPMSMELEDNSGAWPDVNFQKDFVLKLTIPEGCSDANLRDKLIKYFDGELLYEDNKMITIKADRKMITYTLLFSFKQHYDAI